MTSFVVIIKERKIKVKKRERKKERIMGFVACHIEREKKRKECRPDVKSEVITTG